jgi:hypothetical protein
MRFASLLVAFFVPTLAAIAYAECAWVLWTEERNGDGGPPKLWVTDAFSSREECRTRVEYMTADRKGFRWSGGGQHRGHE